MPDVPLAWQHQMTWCRDQFWFVAARHVKLSVDGTRHLTTVVCWYSSSRYKKVRRWIYIWLYNACLWSAQMWPLCNEGITQFYLPPTHEPYLHLLPSHKVSSPFGRYSSIPSGPPHCDTTTMQYETKKTQIHTHTNKSTHSEMGPVWQNPIQRTVRTAHLSVLMTVRNFSTQYNTEQFW